jgi:diaminohydroxyphosphoribosylaminopyrimidine deaminase / 5-amino-6-(5-phosphoribosylamino)uracil reductase
MYVTLEPCCHHGKTPPCTEALINAGISRVVAAMVDPDPRVSGKGAAALRAAGVEVAVGVLEPQVRTLLGPYIKLRTLGRPWVICKWAQTHDGYLALPPGQGRWISCDESRKHVHELRGLCDGICIGVGTVLADDPLLNNRSGVGRQPARLVLDAELRMPLSSRLVQSARQWPVVIAVAEDAAARAAEQVRELESAGAEVLPVARGPGGIDLPSLLQLLGKRAWTHLLVEGGARVLRSFVGMGLADELLVFRRQDKSPVRGSEAELAALPRFDIQDAAPGLVLPQPCVRHFPGDDMLHYVLTRY